jgi:hypothetical protein
MIKVNHQIIVLYLLGIFFLYPVIAHILMYQLGYMTDELPHGKFWMYMQIFISGPALIILGFLLYFKYGRFVINKIFGILFLIIGFYWLYNVVSDVIKEAA